MITDIKLNIWPGVVDSARKQYQIIFKLKRKNGVCSYIYFELHSHMTIIDIIKSIVKLMNLFIEEIE